MSVILSPSARDVQEFQFRLLARLRVFSGYPLPVKQSLSLVAASSKFGLIFIGTSNGFHVIETKRIVEQCSSLRKPTVEVTSYPRRSVTLGAPPSHLDTSCDHTHLAVGCGAGVLRVYDVTSFMAQTERVMSEVRLLAAIQAVSWNPGISNLLAVCLQDGSAAVYEFKGNSFEIHSIPPDAQATCLCWSPKGKQIVIGSRNGNIHQFKPDLKIVKAIPPPQGNMSVVNVQWLSNVQYAAVYSASDGSSPSLFIINTPKGQPVTYINYYDITYSNSDQRLTQFYLIHLQAWNVLLVASANSMEVGVLGGRGADWEQWQLDDAARAELPMVGSTQETLPVGMALDHSSQHNLPWGDNQRLPAMPVMAVLSHEGLLSLYWTVNVMAGATCICEPPAAFPDTSGQHLFTAPPPLPSPQQPPVPPSPAKEPESLPQSQASPQQLVQLPPQAQVSPSPQLPMFSQAQTLLSPQAETLPSPQEQTLPSPQAQTLPSPQAQTLPSPQAQTLLSPQAQKLPSPQVQTLPSLQVLPSPQAQVLPQPQAQILPSSPMGGLNQQLPASTAAPPAPSVQWQQPVASTPPKPVGSVAPPPSPAPGSWMSSPNIPTTFLSAISQPPPGPPSAAPPTQPAPATFSFTPTQPSFSFSNTAAPVTSRQAPAPAPAPATIQVTPVLAPTSAPAPAPASTPAPPQLPPVVLSPISMPSTPDPEADVVGEGEENEELQQMRQALINETIREELSHCETVMSQHRQRVHAFNSNLASVMNNQSLNRLAKDIKEMERFMVKLSETTLAHEQEVGSLRNFLLDAFSYIESMNTRLRFETNPDLWSIHTPQGLDPIQSRRMANIRSNVQMLECTLSRIQLELSSKWAAFCDNNKENRAGLHIPTVESIYQALVVHNNLLMRQRALLDVMEGCVRARSRSEITNLLNHTHTDAHYSKISENLLKLNLSKHQPTPLEELQDSVSNLVLSENSEYKLNTQRNSSADMEAVYRSLSKREIRVLEPTSLCQPSYTNPLRRSKLPIISSSAQYGSISSGQPVISPNKSEPQLTVVSTKPMVIAESAKPSATSSFSSLSIGSTLRQSSKAESPFGTNISPSLQSSTSSAQTVPTPSTSTFSTISPAASVFKSNTNSPQPNTFAAPSTTANKFSFSSLSTNQPSSAFSSPTVFGSNSGTFQTPVSSSSHTFTASAAKPFTFSLAVTTASVSSPTTLTSSAKNESSKSAALTALASPFTVTSPDTAVSVVPASAPQSPLASLSSFVFAVEKSKNESPNKLNTSSDAEKNSQTQPFSFNVSTSSENKVSSKTNLFGSNSENKQDSKDLSSDNGKKDDAGEVKNVFGAGFKVLSFESTPQKSIFGGTPFSADSTTTKPNQASKNLFTFTNTSPNVFGTSTHVTTSQTSSFAFAGTLSPSSKVVDANQQREVQNDLKPNSDETTKPDNLSPIIEVSLSSQKNVGDQKISLEKLSANKGITITKVGPFEEKASTITSEQKTDATASSMFGSLNLDSFTTPTKQNQSIFGGSTPVKPSVTYDITTPEKPVESVLLENKKEGKSPNEEKVSLEQSDQPSKESENKNVPGTTTFTFTIPTETSLSQTTPSIQNEQNTAFTFDMKEPSSTISSSSISSSQSASTFSFAQAASQPSSAPFTFALTTTSTPTTSSSTFAFGLSTGFSDDKSKSTAGFSFSQQAQNAASTGGSIFGGFGSKPVETTSVFGQSTTTTSENKVLFGSSPSVTAENKSVFGQTSPLATEAKSIFDQSQAPTENKNIFGQTPASDTKSVFGQASATLTESKSIFGQTPSTESKSIFGQTSSTATETKSIFGQTPSTAAETKSIFGQVSSTASETKSIFGQTSSTVTDTKSIFGQASSTTTGTKSIFGQTPSTATETKSIFGQTTSTATETKSIFGLTPSTATETKSIFGQTPSTATETKGIFGQPSPGTTVDKPLDFSFSLSSLSTTTATQSSSFFNTPATSSQTSFFGQPVCSPNSTASSSPFGQPASTAASSPFGSKPTFGQSVGSFFGQSGGGFGSSGGSVFGGGAKIGGSPGSIFGGGASAQPATPFGQSTGGGGSLFGGGSFSGSTQSVGQTGFGTAAPAFQNKPAFGSASSPAFGGSPAFGSAPTFGGAPAFGSPPKLFGSPASPAAPAPAFGASPQQQSPTFENLASQNTMTFGNLAQNQPTAFGSVFSSPQNTQPPPAFPPPSNNSMFGGSSFSSWR